MEPVDTYAGQDDDQGEDQAYYCQRCGWEFIDGTYEGIVCPCCLSAQIEVDDA